MKYNITIRIPSSLFEQVKNDLGRPHDHSGERVGFIFSKLTQHENSYVLIFNEYLTVNDQDYNIDEHVGASINDSAIRSAMQLAYSKKKGCFHIHEHYGNGIPSFSDTDEESLPKVIEGIIPVASNQAHGMLLFNEDSFNAYVWLPGNKNYVLADKILLVGSPTQVCFPNIEYPYSSEQYSRQSFLGEEMIPILHKIKVGIIGVGGGGSHLVQQLAHLGIMNYVIVDPDKIELSNLNRLVGGWWSDIEQGTLKVDIAERSIRNINPNAVIQRFSCEWQGCIDFLKQCDFIFGAVDSYITRKDLEGLCRRFLITYIDIGMDVYKDKEAFYMSGQVISSIPQEPCMKCFNYINDANLAEEAGKYGAVGVRPQVIWSNGILASSAIGSFVDLLFDWSGSKEKVKYLAYDGNGLTVTEDIRGKLFKTKPCNHYKIEDTGEFDLGSML